MSREIKVGERERRTVPLGGAIEMRADDEGKPRGAAGRAIPTGVVADIGPFTEEIARSAVSDAIEQGWDVRGLYNHDPNFVLGRTGANTMTLAAKRDGLHYDIPSFPDARADVLEAIERGDVDGNSFSFTVADETWDESEDKEKPHRTIKRFGQLFDVGPVAFPAYEGATTVSARAMDHVRSLEEERSAAGAPDEADEADESGEPADNLSHRKRLLQAAEAEIAAG